MPKLKIAEGLDLPLDVVTQALGFLGRRGSGKSYAATKVAELLNSEGAQFVAIDPVGIWWGLRLASDGKGPGLEIPIFGGLHGDIPLEATAGALIADVVVDRGLSAVLDVSQFESDSDKARFARDFAARFFFRKKANPSAVHVFVEEAQEFIPQNCQKGEEQMLHAWQRMIRLGRNYGIGVSMISQRPQDVNKKALNQAECLFCFQLTGPQERKAVEDWVSDKGLRDDLGRILPELQIGRAHVWSPVWLGINREVHIAKKETFAAGTTPKVGQRPANTKPLAPLEMEKIRQDMAATIEKAKENDPAALRREVAALKAELRRQKPVQEVQTVRTVEVPLLKDGQIKRLESLAARLLEASKTVAGALRSRQSAPPSPVRAAIPRPERPSLPVDNGAPRGGVKRMLNVLAQYPEGRTAKQIGLLAGLSINSGTFTTYLAELRRNGWMEGERSNLRVTAAGLAANGPVNPFPVGPDLLDYWKRELRGGPARMLEALAAAGGRLPREELGVRAGLSTNSGTFTTYLAKLRTLELIEGSSEIVLSEQLL